MKWLTNLFKSKKKKQVSDVAAEQEFRKIIESFKERIEESPHAPNKKANSTGTKKPSSSSVVTVKKVVIKTVEPAEKKPVAKKTTTSKAPATKKPAPKKK